MAEGDGLFVHASLGAVGHVVGCPRGLTEAPDVADDSGAPFPAVGAAWEATGAVAFAVAFGHVAQAETRVTGYGARVSFAAERLNERNRADGVAAN